MGKINWGRVFLCGLLVDVVWTVPYAIIVPLVGRDFVEAVPAIRRPFHGGGLLAFFGVLNFVMGTWTMWLYAAIRPRYGPGPKTAAIAGLAVWVIGGVADAAWAAMGVIPPKVLLAPATAGLPIIIAAAVVGAWAYKE